MRRDRNALGTATHYARGSGDLPAIWMLATVPTRPSIVRTLWPIT
eukprot:COSAG01_NODE_4923_length_4615_cov_3.525232_5_plen_45_part_00